MYSLSIHFGPNAMVWALLFKDKERALAHYSAYETAKGRKLPGRYIVDDDFGQQASVELDSIHGVMLEDMDKSKLGNVEMFMHQKRTEVLATKTAQADPSLRASSMMNGPAMLTPMGGLRQ